LGCFLRVRSLQHRLHDPNDAQAVDGGGDLHAGVRAGQGPVFGCGGDHGGDLPVRSRGGWLRVSMQRGAESMKEGAGLLLRLCVTVVVASAVGAGCVPAPYATPRPDQPQAVVKIRRVYHAFAGETLSENAQIDGHTVFQGGRRATDSEPQTSPVRVHPLAARWVVSSGFSHIEQRMVSEAYTVYTTQMVSETTYQQQSYSCGSYSNGRYASQTCYRSVPHHRMVSKQVPHTRYRQLQRSVAVSDGGCARYFNFHPEAGKMYLLEYSYLGPSICTLTSGLDQLTH
jgi:hypothetical protein